jgi:hypothetical protein
LRPREKRKHGRQRVQRLLTYGGEGFLGLREQLPETNIVRVGVRDDAVAYSALLAHHGRGLSADLARTDIGFRFTLRLRVLRHRRVVLRLRKRRHARKGFKRAKDVTD